MEAQFRPGLVVEAREGDPVDGLGEEVVDRDAALDREADLVHDESDVVGVLRGGGVCTRDEAMDGGPRCLHAQHHRVEVFLPGEDSGGPCHLPEEAIAGVGLLPGGDEEADRGHEEPQLGHEEGEDEGVQHLVPPTSPRGPGISI